jgi:Uma2 family endonuclease
MIPFPLPPVLAHLHEILEGYAELHDRGFFMAEQDRNHEARNQPVLMYLCPTSLKDEKSTERRAPTWMGEVILTDQSANPERLVRYAKAGVVEFWRVRQEAEGYAVEVHTDPSGETYGAMATFRGEEPVVSQVFTELELTPASLPAG